MHNYTESKTLDTMSFHYLYFTDCSPACSCCGVSWLTGIKANDLFVKHAAARTPVEMLQSIYDYTGLGETIHNTILDSSLKTESKPQRYSKSCKLFAAENSVFYFKMTNKNNWK